MTDRCAGSSPSSLYHSTCGSGLPPAIHESLTEPPSSAVTLSSGDSRKNRGTGEEYRGKKKKSKNENRVHSLSWLEGQVIQGVIQWKRDSYARNYKEKDSVPRAKQTFSAAPNERNTRKDQNEM